MVLTMIPASSDSDVSGFILSSYDQEFHEMEVKMKLLEEDINKPGHDFTDLNGFLTRYGKTGGPVYSFMDLKLIFRYKYTDTDGREIYRFSISVMRGTSERLYPADVFYDGKIRTVFRGL